MFRLFILLNLLLLNLFACKGGYQSCIQKINDSLSIQKNSLYIPVKGNKRLVYTPCKLNEKVLKHDPFLGLSLVTDKSNFAYDFDVNMRIQLGEAVVDAKEVREGKITQEQLGLSRLARFNENYKAPALLMSSCCSLEGLVTPRGIIQKEYLAHFLGQERVEYGDIGIRVSESKNGVKVVASDPFLENNPYKKGDIIHTLNGEKVTTAAALMRKILLSKPGSSFHIVVKRGSEILSFQTNSVARVGGGLVSDTFLERRGIYFDEKLHIVELEKKFTSQGLLIGDRLIKVNGVTVKNQEELREYVEDFKEFSSLLFERKEFQFFVNIK